MRPSGKIVAIAVGAFGLCAVSYAAYERLYAGERRELSAQIQAERETIDSRRGQINERVEIARRRKALVETTLGGDLETVDSEFRRMLNDIALESGLAERAVEVSTRSPRGTRSPASRLVSTGFSRLLDSEADFFVVPGSLEGVGTLDEVLRALASVAHQPWVHRVDTFSIKPRRENALFDLRVGVATGFIAGEKPREAPGITPLPSGSQARWASIVQKDVFHEPAPEAPPVKPAEPVHEAPKDPPPPPYRDWRQVGVWDGASGVWVVMTNLKTGENKVLYPGESILDVKFLEGGGERAVFELNGRRFELFNGSTLAQRRAIDD